MAMAPFFSRVARFRRELRSVFLPALCCRASSGAERSVAVLLLQTKCFGSVSSRSTPIARVRVMLLPVELPAPGQRAYLFSIVRSLRCSRGFLGLDLGPSQVFAPVALFLLP